MEEYLWEGEHQEERRGQRHGDTPAGGTGGRAKGKRFSRRRSWSAADLSDARRTPLKTAQSQKSLAAALTPCVDLTDIC